jgi:hypothetical protein
MSKRLVLSFVLSCLLPLASASAAEEGPVQPSLVIRFNSLEQLLADARYLAKLADREELVKQVESLLKARAGEKGLDGFDPKKPIGFYANIGPNGIDSTGALLVPVADEKALLGLLEKLAIKVEKGKEGVYSVFPEQSPFPVLFRFARGYAFVTLGIPGNEKVLLKDSNLDPAIVFPKGPDGAASLTLHIDRIPTKLKELLLGQTELRLAGLKDREAPGETKAQHDFRVALLDEVGTRFKSALKDGGEVSLRLDIDRTNGDLNVSASFAGKPGSQLAAEITDLGKVKSLAASLLGSESAMSLAAAVVLPEKLRKALEPVVEEGLKKDAERVKDATLREATERVIRALMPTIRASELDGGTVLRGPAADGTYALLAAVRLQNGKQLEKEFREVMKRLESETGTSGTPKVTFDLEKAGSVSIHRMERPKSEVEFRKLFGDRPVYFAFRDDALLAGAGEKALDALKETVAATPKPGKLLQAEMSLSRLAPALGVSNQAMPEAAKRAFADNKDADKIRLTLEGGSALQLKLAMKAPLITFFNELDKARKKGE